MKTLTFCNFELFVEENRYAEIDDFSNKDEQIDSSEKASHLIIEKIDERFVFFRIEEGKKARKDEVYNIETKINEENPRQKIKLNKMNKLLHFMTRKVIFFMYQILIKNHFLKKN